MITNKQNKSRFLLSKQQTNKSSRAYNKRGFFLFQIDVGMPVASGWVVCGSYITIPRNHPY